MDFKLVSSYSPRGDQATAIEQLTRGLDDGEKHQVLLGVTGSGKTFTMAKVIERLNRTTLVLAHNKTLAAQLYHEFRGYFPENAVEYFVSYYDYYQPEAYIASTDTYIEKESTINDEIDRLRLSATRSLFEQRLPALELLLDRADRLLQARPRHDEMAFGIDRQAVELPDLIAGERIERGELIDVVAPEFDSESDVFVRRMHLDGVASNAEDAALEIQIIALIENLDEFGENLAAADVLAALQHQQHAVVGFRRSQAVNTGYRRHDDYIAALKQ